MVVCRTVPLSLRHGGSIYGSVLRLLASVHGHFVSEKGRGLMRRCRYCGFGLRVLWWFFLLDLDRDDGVGVPAWVGCGAIWRGFLMIGREVCWKEDLGGGRMGKGSYLLGCFG